MTNFERVKNIIANTLEIDDVETITMETSIMNDLDADSLDAVEVMMALEDEFNIEIPDEDAEGFQNIGDIVKYIEEKLANILFVGRHTIEESSNNWIRSYYAHWHRQR